MNKQQLTYIEESGILFEQLGMTRMAGRVFGYLVVSDKSESSFHDIHTALKASKGSISGTTKQLINTGFVEPVSLPGDRKTYYRLNKMEVGKILQSRVQLFNKFSEMLAKGMNLKNRKDDISVWLEEVSTFYDWVGGEINIIIDKWKNEKDEIIKKHGKQSKQSE